MEATIKFPARVAQTLKVSLVEGKYILSKRYLESKLGSEHKLQSLNAVVESMSDNSCLIPMATHKDIEGNEQYIIDDSLSLHYVVVECNSVENPEGVYRGECSQHVGFPQSDDEVIALGVAHTKSTCNPQAGVDVDSSPSKEENVKEGVINLDSPTTTADKKENVGLTEGKSVIEIILSSRKTTLAKMLKKITSHHIVDELPRIYDGDVVLEFPPTMGRVSPMSGMEQKYDGHMWTKPVTTNVSFDGTVRLSYCVGVLECPWRTCPYVQINGMKNNAFFRGTKKKKCMLGVTVDGLYGTIRCHFCKKPPICIDTCECLLYYVMPRKEAMTRLMIHIGKHKHVVQPGTSMKCIERTRTLVQDAVAHDRSVRPRKLQMSLAKDLIMSSMLRQDRRENEHIGEVELTNFLEELVPLVESQRLRRMVSNARSALHPAGDGIEGLLLLKKNSMYEFFHGSRFPGQGVRGERCYVFKMSTKGPASGVDLVNRMRRDGAGDLRSSWIQFDHTRRVVGWSTMACHVYDPSVQELLTVATCEMKEEDTDSQVLFWEMLNNVMQQCGYKAANFYGFMADEAQSNWRAIRTVYNNGPNNEMLGQERSCLFHWKQSLNIHTTRYVNKDYQNEHKDLCEQWRTSRSKEEAATHSRMIRQWWRTGKVNDKHLPAMDIWMSWWSIRIAHWGNCMAVVEDSADAVNTPRTNLSEAKHGSWLAGEGNRAKISLYDACVSDMANALLQSAKQYAYMLGRHLGQGPSLQNLVDRSASARAPRPIEVIETVQEAIVGTPMHQKRTNLEGDRETVSVKRRGSTVVIDVDEHASHRPEYNLENRQRKERTQPRRLYFGSGQQSTQGEPSSSSSKVVIDGQEICEHILHKTAWAIRRTTMNSRIKCLGWVTGRGKCSRFIEGCAKGAPAPSFFSERSHPHGKTQQMMWFCNTDITHTWNIDKNISPIPGKAPTCWPVSQGTNLTQVEVDNLVRAGFNIETKPTNIGNEDIVIEETHSGVPIRDDSRHPRYRRGISQAAEVKIKKAISLQASVVTEKVLDEGRSEIFEVESMGSKGTSTKYDVHIKSRPSCTCPDFQKRITESKPYLACKHIYFIFLRVLGLDQNTNMFIHQPILTESDLFRALTRERTYP